MKSLLKKKSYFNNYVSLSFVICLSIYYLMNIMCTLFCNNSNLLIVLPMFHEGYKYYGMKASVETDKIVSFTNA